VSEVVDKTTVRAQLPRMNIEITHSCAPEHTGERLSITIEAVPSFAAFGSYLEALNPFAFWSEAMRLAWLPWLGVAQAALPLAPRDGAASRSERNTR
jgi:hypothetical protein